MVTAGKDSAGTRRFSMRSLATDLKHKDQFNDEQRRLLPTLMKKEFETYQLLCSNDSLVLTHKRHFLFDAAVTACL